LKRICSKDCDSQIKKEERGKKLLSSFFFWFNYFTIFHAAGKAMAAANNLITSPIKNGTMPNATALLKLPNTTDNHVMPQA
jgi:hypothetical protein